MNEVISHQTMTSTEETPVSCDIVNTNGQPCMKDCNVSTKVIGRARDIDVTPEDESS